MSEPAFQFWARSAIGAIANRVVVTMAEAKRDARPYYGSLHVLRGAEREQAFRREKAWAIACAAVSIARERCGTEQEIYACEAVP